MAASVAQLLRIRHAVTALAECDGEHGSAAKSFVRGTYALFHGNQWLAGSLNQYNPDRRIRRSDHTLENIFLAIDRGFADDTAEEMKIQMAKYLIFDALIGNTDRHHENWGILKLPVRGEWSTRIGYLAPSFDHASSLGRELADEGPGKCRREILNAGDVGPYSERAQGRVFWSASDASAPSPLELIRRGSVAFPAILQPALEVLRNIDVDQLDNLTRRIPETWMSPLARRFAFELMGYNLTELRKLAR